MNVELIEMVVNGQQINAVSLQHVINHLTCLEKNIQVFEE